MIDLDTLDIGSQISLQIGVPMRLEMDGISIPLESAFVGIEDNYLILRAPNPYSIVEHKLYRGSELVVKYISNGTVYAFQTKVYDNIKEPIRLLLLEYPKVVQKHELRKHRRTKCYIPVTSEVRDYSFSGAIVDITKRGCRCLLNRADTKKLTIYIDDSIILKCKFPGIKGKIPLVGVVKNLKKTLKELDVGLNFTPDTKEESRKIVSWYVTTIEDYIE